MTKNAKRSYVCPMIKTLKNTRKPVVNCFMILASFFDHQLGNLNKNNLISIYFYTCCLVYRYDIFPKYNRKTGTQEIGGKKIEI